MSVTENTKTILKRMLSKINSIYDKSEGSFFYDLLSPVAIELNTLKEKISTMFDSCFADTATKSDLDRICKTVGIYRKMASNASGYVTIKGISGAKIVKGEYVSCGLINFAFTESTTVPESGEIKVLVQCVSTGTIGNVDAGSIVNFPKTLEGLTSVTNENAFINGYAEETDEELRERYYLKARTPSTSGNKNHYVLWSREVVGVGDAKCVPRWNGRGTVKVVIINSNKKGADNTLVKAVADYIEEQRPIGADVTVVSATEVPITVNVKIILNSEYDLSTVTETIKTEIDLYLKDNAFNYEYVSIAKISQIILQVTGVEDIDFESMNLNGESRNVQIASDEIAVLSAVNVEV